MGNSIVQRCTRFSDSSIKRWYGGQDANTKPCVDTKPELQNSKEASAAVCPLAGRDGKRVCLIGAV